MQIKKKKQLTVHMDGNKASIKSKDIEANEHPKAKESSAMPMSVSAALGSLKKAPSISAKIAGSEVKAPTANTEAMDDGHSEAYKERIKKRVK